MGMEGLGRLFNILPVADALWIPMAQCAAVTFVGYLAAGDTFTVQQATAAAGTGNTNLATVTQYYTSDGLGGAWTKRTQAAAATVVIAGTAGLDACVFTIGADELGDGYTHVNCTSTSTGTVVAIMHDLYVQRAPANLPALV